MTRNEAYESLVSKLVNQVHAICEENDIPCLMIFEVGTTGDSEAEFVTTMIVQEDASQQMHDLADEVIECIQYSESTDADGMVN